MSATAPDGGADTPSAEALELAERIVVELQRVRDFFEAEWEAQMRWMESETGDSSGLGAAEAYADLLRDQQIEMPAQEWARALARSIEPRQLAGIVDLLERSEYQDWIEMQLRIYPEYTTAVLQQLVAASEVVAEEMISAHNQQQPLDFEPVADSPLARVFDHVPGSRVDATLEQQMYFHQVRIAVDGGPLAVAFDDYTVRLLPDGDAARVASINAERAFSDMAACDIKRQQLEASLAGLFEDSEETDCDFTRHLSAGGDTRMSLRCSEQTLLGAHATLSLDITHEPTQNAMFTRGGFWDDGENSESGEAPTAED